MGGLHALRRLCGWLRCRIGSLRGFSQHSRRRCSSQPPAGSGARHAFSLRARCRCSHCKQPSSCAACGLRTTIDRHQGRTSRYPEQPRHASCPTGAWDQRSFELCTHTPGTTRSVTIGTTYSSDCFGWRQLHCSLPPSESTQHLMSGVIRIGISTRSPLSSSAAPTRPRTQGTLRQQRVVDRR